MNILPEKCQAKLENADASISACELIDLHYLIAMQALQSSYGHSVLIGRGKGLPMTRLCTTTPENANNRHSVRHCYPRPECI
ncbi:MAG: hypothetical protein DMG81_15145 [Acidobacteria bacterium]|nr:MAG: hypothetical protein DMG81_15145 [Acidobacteriota bacterium]